MPSAFGKPVTTANRFGAAATAQNMTLLTTLTASASSSLQYTGFASASYKKYRIVVYGIMPVTNGTNLCVRASVDSGANFTASWQGAIITCGNVGTTPVVTQQGGVTYFPLTVSSSSSVTLALCYGEADWTYPPVTGGRPSLIGTCGTKRYDYSVPGPCTTYGVFDNATEVNTLNFSFDSGNIASGNIKIYGIAST